MEKETSNELKRTKKTSYISRLANETVLQIVRCVMENKDNGQLDSLLKEPSGEIIEDEGFIAIRDEIRNILEKDLENMDDDQILQRADAELTSGLENLANHTFSFFQKRSEIVKDETMESINKLKNDVEELKETSFKIKK